MESFNEWKLRGELFNSDVSSALTEAMGSLSASDLGKYIPPQSSLRSSHQHRRSQLQRRRLSSHATHTR